MYRVKGKKQYFGLSYELLLGSASLTVLRLFLYSAVFPNVTFTFAIPRTGITVLDTNSSAINAARSTTFTAVSLVGKRLLRFDMAGRKV